MLHLATYRCFCYRYRLLQLYTMLFYISLIALILTSILALLLVHILTAFKLTNFSQVWH